MGRKGVSKRKPGKSKSAPVVSEKASGSVSSVFQSADSQPGKAIDTGRAAVKPSSDGKKKSKKG